MLKDKILKLKEEKDAVILAHNYQIPDVQDVADFVGDSLGLARQAAKTNHKTILFCGVHFMAETAAIISPEKKVLIPDLEAGCSLSDSITTEQLKKWKKEHPNAITVGYVNTTAEIKSELDYWCTSSYAVNVVKAIPSTKDVLFLPIFINLEEDSLLLFDENPFYKNWNNDEENHYLLNYFKFSPLQAPRSYIIFSIDKI